MSALETASIIAGGDLVAKDVGYARVVAAAVQVAPVPGKHEALRDGLPEAELAQWFHVSGKDFFELPHAQELVPIGLAHRCR